MSDQSEPNEMGAAYKITGTRTQDESVHYQPTHVSEMYQGMGALGKAEEETING